MTRKSLIALAVLTALSTATAFAVAQSQPAPVQGKPQPAAKAKLDANGDGYVDRAEAAQYSRLAQKFDQLDADKDGRLGPDELKRPGRGGHDRKGDRRFALAGKPGPHMNRLDTDGDGRISRAEAAAHPRFAERFDQMDLNQDGFVDRVDHQARAEQRRDTWFAQADTNGDGQLSRAEYDAAHQKTQEKMQQRMEARRTQGTPRR